MRKGFEFHLISTELFILPKWQSSVTKHQRKEKILGGVILTEGLQQATHPIPSLASSQPLPAWPR